MRRHSLKLGFFALALALSCCGYDGIRCSEPGSSCSALNP